MEKEIKCYPYAPFYRFLYFSVLAILLQYYSAHFFPPHGVPLYASLALCRLLNGT